MKYFLISFHVLLIVLTSILLVINIQELIVVAILPIILNILIIVFVRQESRFVLIPSIFLIIIFTFGFSLMTIGNISWSQGIINLIILFYLLFLGVEILTIIYALKFFKKQL